MRIWLTAFLTMGFVLTSGLSIAEPFVVSDPYPRTGEQPAEFVIVAGQLKFSVPAEKLPDGTVRLKFDLSRLPDGESVLSIKAVDRMKGTESEAVSLRVMKDGKNVTLLREQKVEPAKEKRPPSRTIPGLLSRSSTPETVLFPHGH